MTVLWFQDTTFLLSCTPVFSILGSVITSTSLKGHERQRKRVFSFPCKGTLLWCYLPEHDHVGPITQGSLDNVIIRCCVLLISATVKKGVSRVGVKALATSGIRSLIQACLTGGTESHACVPASRELRKECFPVSILGKWKSQVGSPPIRKCVQKVLSSRME